MKPITNFLSIFFGVLVRKQTYLNGLYLLLNLPLGIAYGILLMTGWFLGYGFVWGGWQALILATNLYSSIKILFVLISGICVWLLITFTCWLPANIERQLACWLLGVDITPAPIALAKPSGTWRRIRKYLLDPVTWKSLIFIALKFPVGIASFSAVIGLTSAAAAMLCAPLVHLIGFKSFIIGPWRIDTWKETFLASILGVLVVPLSLHILNGLALVSGWFAKMMLGGGMCDQPQKPQKEVSNVNSY